MVSCPRSTGARRRRLLSATALLALLARRRACAALSPGGRAYERVSPNDKFGGQAGGAVDLADYAYVTPDGKGIFFRVAGASEIGAARGLQDYAVARRTATGWSVKDPFPLPSGAISFADYKVNTPWPSDDLGSIAYMMGGGGLVPGNPAVPNHLAGQPSAQGLYRTGPDGSPLTWLSEPTISAPVPSRRDDRGPVVCLPVRRIPGSQHRLLRLLRHARRRRCPSYAERHGRVNSAWGSTGTPTGGWRRRESFRTARSIRSGRSRPARHRRRTGRRRAPPQGLPRSGVGRRHACPVRQP